MKLYVRRLLDERNERLRDEREAKPKNENNDEEVRSREVKS